MLPDQLATPKITCLVAVKKVISPYATIKPSTDFANMIMDKIPMIMNPLDEIALEEADRLKKQGFISEILAVTIGDNCQDILLQALARGADRAIFIKTEHQFISPLNVAKILHHLVIENQINLVFLGKQAIDNNYNQTGQMLAGLLDWPQACAVAKIDFDNTNMPYTVTVNSEIASGIEILKITLPTVITVDSNVNEPRSISLPNLIQAKKKPLATIVLSDLLPTIKHELLLDNIKVQKICAAAARPTGVKVDVPTLINKLKHEDQVIF